MITIPLSDVVAFLQRKVVDLACLEGAPWGPFSGANLEAIRPMDLGDGSRIRRDAWLYLGSSNVCLAAMGWATAVLGAGRCPHPCLIENPDGSTELYRCSSDEPSHQWSWHDVSAIWTDDEETCFPLPMPPTPAERLRAVLLHEMERA